MDQDEESSPEQRDEVIGIHAELDELKRMTRTKERKKDRDAAAIRPSFSLDIIIRSSYKAICHSSGLSGLPLQGARAKKESGFRVQFNAYAYVNYWEDRRN